MGRLDSMLVGCVLCVACSSSAAPMIALDEPAAPQPATLPSAAAGDFIPAAAHLSDSRIRAPAPQLPLPRLGLRRLDFDDPYTSSGAGHMVQISITGDLAFVANSMSGVTTYRTASDGTLDLLSRTSTPSLRCTTVASHEPSHTVFCAAPDPSSGGPVGRVYGFDVSDPRVTRLRPGALYTTDLGAIGDLHVAGSALFAAAGPGGLLRADIDEFGALSDWRLLYTGYAFAADVDATRAAVLDRERGLVVLDSGTGHEIASEGLAGPALDVRLVDDRVAVALGSEGVRVWTVDTDSLTPLGWLRPRCVADAVDIDGDRLAVGCITGIYVYDMSADPPRLIGFEPARGGVRDLRFVDGDLIVADFSRISRLSVDDEGSPLLIDATWNAPYDSHGVAHVTLRNEANEARVVEVRVNVPSTRMGASLGIIRVPARGSASRDFTVSELAPWVGEETAATHLRLVPIELERLRRAGLVSPAQQTATEVRLLRVAPAEPARIRPGERLPDLGLADDHGASVTVRPAPARLVAYQPDCALMWPELMELAWQKRHGGPAHPPTPVASFFDSRVVRYLGLDVFTPLVFGEGAVIAPDGTRTPLGYDLYDSFLAVEGSRNGAHWPTDYVVDADGRVARIERAYRGRWPL